MDWRVSMNVLMLRFRGSVGLGLDDAVSARLWLAL